MQDRGVDLVVLDQGIDTSTAVGCPLPGAGDRDRARARRVRAFANMMVRRRGHLLEEWITAAVADGDPHLAGFAEGLRRDQAAVTAGLTLPTAAALSKAP
jgi:hypothetical protein